MSPAYYSLLRCVSGSPSLSSYFFPSSSPSPAQPQSSPSRHLPCSALRLKSPKQNISRCRSSSPAPVSLSREAAGQSAIQRISEKLRSLGYIEDNVGSGPGDPPPTGPGSPGEIFIPTPYEIPKHRVGYTIDPSWGTPEHPVPEPGSGATIARFRELWKREKERESSQPARNDAKVPTVAELTLTRRELKRLRTLGIALTKRLKVGKAGITEGIVNGIHERWRRSEVVKIKCEDICLLNMKRTHQILETKTGGLVVWRSGSIVVLYRGTGYKYPYFHAGEEKNLSTYEESVESNVHHVAETDRRSGSLLTHGANTSSKSTASIVTPKYVAGVGSPNKLRFQLPGEAQLEEEAERLLDGLGPRFTDWWGYSPHPVDADLLPPIVLSYRKPFRLLPFGLKPKLTDREATILKRLSRHIPFHFALGRNKNLQGLAVSMLKLWEKCEVAKIAVKRGVQNTNSEMMAEELKKLTGGTLLSRDKDFIIFYRGKDFLPPVVSIAIEERRKLNCGDKKQMEEQISPSISIFSPKFLSTSPASDGEVHVAGNKERSLLAVRNAKSACSALRKVEAKLNWTKQKIEKTEKHLAEYEKLVEPSEVESDKEGISKEERYMLRRVGLRMKPFLLLGRRDVFDGTVENMHLHWKYRELVKIICNNRCIENVERDARTLESESGGILVAVERVSKGYAIIIFRGKNYRRPADLRPKTLLNKKEALKRALEAQRYKSLKLYALRLSENIDGFNHQVGVLFTNCSALLNSYCSL
ncbi:Chloroplastic group IIA intron splicing facilitator CRS1, chloroplastic [Apostasia shenzhenica]|uniref:CRM-domain containing factor CFM3, chloroplastic/mitochondrial n=1 Tax=Apostasia shenzhenica TaxID=1088818 RepID=A0A2H9ZZV0_9ASPA|nr:Chloroplastic group IIA intron splicing facilitator CRS1, chloroplastic [Apostasia shenzhenica]